MSQFNVTLVAVGGFTLISAFLAGAMRRRVDFASEPLAAVVLGVAIGPAGLGLVSLGAWAPPLAIVEQISRLTLALAVMAAALRLRGDYFGRQTAALAVMVGPAMAVEWLVSGLLIHWLAGLPFWAAMVAGAAVAPTDPVLAGSVVSGRSAKERVPDRLRDLLTAESGINDGSAYPFIFLAILVMSLPLGDALSEWAVRTVLWEVVAAAGIGAVVGVAAGLVHRRVQRRDLNTRTSITTATVALALAVAGLVKLLGGDGLLSAFTAGFGYIQIVEQENRSEQDHVQETIRRLFSFPILVLFGTVLPWGAWADLGYRGLALVVAVLLVRRLPAVGALSRFVDPIERRADALFVGWFGPIGIGAIFYAALAVRITGLRRVWSVVSLVVAGSVLAYGVTATPFTRYYGRATGRTADDGAGSTGD